MSDINNFILSTTGARDIDPAIWEIAWRAQLRLHHQYKKLTARGKHRNVAVTAVAPELVVFIWDAARLVPSQR